MRMQMRRQRRGKIEVNAGVRRNHLRRIINENEMHVDFIHGNSFVAEQVPFNLCSTLCVQI